MDCDPTPLLGRGSTPDKDGRTGWFERLFNDGWSSKPEVPQTDESERDFAAEAIDAWGSGRIEIAENLFKKAIQSAIRTKSDDRFKLDYCLGRFGAFLMDQERDEEALEALNRSHLQM